MSRFYDMTPKEIVAELDKYIIGQESAKKSVAVALRNRYRRNLLPEEMKEEITPKNILMMGPTGVGKTEIARRLAKLMDAPFVKVEATKFTEVGYVGRDVETMVRDLMEAAMRLTKQKHIDEKYSVAEHLAEEKIIEAIIPGKKKSAPAPNANNPFGFLMGFGGATYNQTSEKIDSADDHRSESDIELAREQVRQQLKAGLLEDQYIEIDVVEQPKENNLDVSQGGTISLGSIFGDAMPKKTKRRKMKIKDARKILIEQEAANMIDMDQVTSEALENCEQNGIIFIDEIDKIASGSSYRSGADVSREGVQRDILPIVEGSVVNTKYGPVKTDHVLFIGAGCTAGRLEIAGTLKALEDLSAGILPAGPAVVQALLPHTADDVVAAPVGLPAAGTGDLLPGDDPVPVADLFPQPRRVPELLRGLLIRRQDIPRTGRAVVPAGRDHPVSHFPVPERRQAMAARIRRSRSS